VEAALIAGVFLLATLVNTPKEIPIWGRIVFCPFHSMTGYSCPGCGMTRAFIALMHGRFAEALHFHIMAFPLFLLLLLRLGSDFAAVSFGEKTEIKHEALLFYACAGLFVLFGLLRLGLEMGGVLQPV
ncbi:MAG: hypothetical protein A2X49_06105, partial [Lentisphaerae bacterium GWF2_52_8]